MDLISLIISIIIVSLVGFMSYLLFILANDEELKELLRGDE